MGSPCSNASRLFPAIALTSLHFFLTISDSSSITLLLHLLLRLFFCLALGDSKSEIASTPGMQSRFIPRIITKDTVRIKNRVIQYSNRVARHFTTLPSGDNIYQATSSCTHGTYDNEAVGLRACVSETACKTKTREKKKIIITPRVVHFKWVKRSKLSPQN